jgi:hypothetical protein
MHLYQLLFYDLPSLVPEVFRIGKATQFIQCELLHPADRYGHALTRPGLFMHHLGNKWGLGLAGISTPWLYAGCVEHSEDIYSGYVVPCIHGFLNNPSHCNNHFSSLTEESRSRNCLRHSPACRAQRSHPALLKWRRRGH